MKKRSGFVSNSSSSSFIIQMDEPIKSASDLEKVFKEFVYETYEKAHILSKRQLAEYAFGELTCLNDKFNNKVNECLVKTLTKKEIDIDQNTPEYTRMYLKYAQENADPELAEYILESENIKERINDRYEKDINLSLGKDDLDSEERDAILDQEYPDVRAHYDKWFCDDTSSEFYNKDRTEYAMLYKAMDFHDEYYYITYLKEDFLKWVSSNKKYFYTFTAEGQGNGWVSTECNGIYETDKDLVFNNEFLVDSTMD